MTARFVVPSAVTLLGLVCSVLWLSGVSPVFALAGLFCDVLDGRVARWLRAETAFGRWFDWYTDVCVCVAIAALCDAGPGLILAVPMWAAAACDLGAPTQARFSGRALATFLALAWGPASLAWGPS